MIDYKAIRRLLHEHPQTAGNEQFAHDNIVKYLQSLHPDKVYTQVGGWGVIAVWGKDPQTPTVALRADTDALPIGHRCGHDGHTTILLRLAELVDGVWHDNTGMARNVLLLWQPAEETGTGSMAVIESGILQQYNITAFYGFHNLPGYAMGTVVLCPHTFAAASSGVVYHFDGRETHASTPELGLNPGLAVSEIIQRFAQFNQQSANRQLQTFTQSTLICVRVGSPAFGTSAGHGEVMFTLRAFTNAAMQRLLDEANAVVDEIASRHGLQVNRSLVEPFHATENQEMHVERIRKAAGDLSLKVVEREEPMRWSEDFAEYLMRWPGAMCGIGSGEEQPELHHPQYVFPDVLIEDAAQLLLKLSEG